VQQRGEFVAAETRENRRIAEFVPEQARDLEQQPVAGGVAEAVVDLLELVEIEIEQGALAVVLFRLLQRLGQLLGEVMAVEKPGEGSCWFRYCSRFSTALRFETSMTTHCVQFSPLSTIGEIASSA
jgi:hypothetical protein